MLHKAFNVDDLLHLLKPSERVEQFALHTTLWHRDEEPAATEDDVPLRLHLANFTLWHLEDCARDPLATDAAVAGLKRQIDKSNQSRNDLVERLDVALLQALALSSLPAPEAPLHSETPGLILDRLSILTLKIFHTAEEIARADASPAHRERNQDRLIVLKQQSSDLAGCLEDLWHDVCHGKRGYKLYQQMKMYNDPELNPLLYTAAAKGTVPQA